MKTFLKQPLPTDPIEKRVRYAIELFHELSEPLLREKSRIYAFYSEPRMLVRPDGIEALPSRLPPWAEQLTGTLDTAILEVKNRCLRLAHLPPT